MVLSKYIHVLIRIRENGDGPLGRTGYMNFNFNTFSIRSVSWPVHRRTRNSPVSNQSFFFSFVTFSRSNKIFNTVKFQKGVPPQDPFFSKNGQINRVTKVSSTFRPIESDSEKKLGGYLDSRRGNWIWKYMVNILDQYEPMYFKIQFPRLESR